MFKIFDAFKLGSLGAFGGTDGFVALDIGSSSIKMVETAIEKNRYHLLSLATAPLPLKAIQNNMVVDQRSVADAIRGLIQRHNVAGTKVISAVPGRAAIMKKVQMPRQEETELEANVEFEANSVIPENLENVNLDYQVLSLLDGGSKMDVLLVAVKKEIVNSYADAIEQAGLTPAIMDVDYFAMENMYEANYTGDKINGIVALIQMGARYTSITFLQNGISTFTGDLPIGGEEFTDALRRDLGVSNEVAENFKITGVIDGKKTLEIDALVKPVAENFVDEIRRMVSLYGGLGSDEGDGLKHIYLSGGSAKIAGFRSLLGERMGVPVTLAEPFRGFTVNKAIDKAYLESAGALFAVGSGLSIRRPGDK